MRILLLWALPSLAHAAAPLALGHQGRLLSADGAPVNGPHDIRVTLYDTAAQADPGLWTRQFAALPVQDGYYAVTLVLDDASQPLDPADFDDGEVWVGVAVDGAPLGERQRLGSVPFAISAGSASSGGASVPIATNASGACSVGSVVYDTATASLRVCQTGTWGVEIENAGSFRRWSDGTYAGSCNAYRNPGPGRAYAGATGSGVYRLDVSGSVFDAWCDMVDDGGGWTLVARVVLGANLTATGAVGTTPVLPTQVGFGKLSDAMIAAIRANTSYTGPTDLRMTCEFAPPMTQYCSSTCSFGANNVVNTTQGCNQCATSFEGPLTALAPNEGTRGFGHHHATGWFAYQSTHYSSQGCHADQYNGITSGNASGNLWVK